MTHVELTRNDLLNSLEEQLYFLDSSISNFSSYKTAKKCVNKVMGKSLQIEVVSEVEAKRIAVIAQLLLHDTPKSFSLLGKLGMKESLRLVDTAASNDGRLHSMTNLHGVRGSRSDHYYGLVAKINDVNGLNSVPLYIQHLKEWHDQYPKLKFEDWWQNRIVIKLGTTELSREKLIGYARNKDGGAHIDKDGLPVDYEIAKRTNLRLNIEGHDTEFGRNVVYASIAQIGWELLNSIEIDPPTSRR